MQRFSQNDITVVSKPSHPSSLNFWISALVDETKCMEFKMSLDWLCKAQQSLSVISIVSFSRCKMKTNSNEVNPS